MDTRQLKTLVAIANNGTFAKAADEVFLTPSAVSQQMQALEQELNATLFDRLSRPPKLTPQGIQVYEMAQNILRLEDNAKASLRGDKISGTLMIGSVRTSALSLLPRSIKLMRKEYPDLKINLQVALSANLITDVATGRLDAAVVAEHISFPPALRWSPFLKEPLLLIAPKDTHPQSVHLMLSTLPFIRFRSGVPLATLIDTEISRMGIITNDVAEIDTIGSIVTCVRQGMGISIVPLVALEEFDDREIVRIPFGEPQVTRQIGIVERTVSPREQIVEQLHALLAELCGEHGVERA